jgi:hypothetical protein
MGVAGVSDYQIWPENVAQPRAGLEQSLRARLIGSSESCRLVNGALHGARNKWAFFGAGRLRENCCRASFHGQAVPSEPRFAGPNLLNER